MSDVEIGARLKVDTGNSAKSIDDIKAALQAAKKEMSGAIIGSNEYVAATKKLAAAEAELSNVAKETPSQFGALKDKLVQTVPVFGQATTAGTGFNSVLNLLKANPLVFILVGLVAILKGLYEAFASTFEGGKKVEQVFAGIKAAAQVVQDRLVLLASATVKLFSGDFKGAMNDAKASVTGLGTEIQAVYSKTAQLTKQLQDIKKQERESNVDEAQRATRLALLREQLNDENVSLKEKKRIALELKKDVDENYADDLRRDREKARIKIELLKQQKDGERKNADEIAQIQIDLANAETANALEGVRVNKQIRALDTQEKQAASEKAKAAAASSKEARQKAAEAEKQEKENNKAFSEKFLKLQNDNELLEIKDSNQKKLLELRQQLESERKLINDDYRLQRITLQQKSQLLSASTRNYDLQVAETRAAIAKEQLDAETKANEKRTADGLAHAQSFTAGLKELSDTNIAQSKLEAEEKIKHQNTVADTLIGLSSLIGEQTVIGKGLAAAAALMNTYQGATKALAQGGIFGYIGAAGVVASGLASVKKILSTQIPGKSSGSGPAISASAISAPVAPPAPVAQTTTLDNNSIQSIGNAANRAFVVERDMTNNQERIRQLNRAARIG